MTTASQAINSEPRSIAQYLYGDFGELGGDTSPAATALAMQTLSMLLSPLALTRGVVAGVNNVTNDQTEKDIAWSAIFADVIYGAATFVPFCVKLRAPGRFFNLKHPDMAQRIAKLGLKASDLPPSGLPPTFLENLSSSLARNHLLVGCARILEPLAVGAGFVGAGIDAIHGDRDAALTSLAYMAPHLLWMAPIAFKARGNLRALQAASAGTEKGVLSKALAVMTPFFPHTDRAGVAKELTKDCQEMPAKAIWKDAKEVIGPSMIDRLAEPYNAMPRRSEAPLGQHRVSIIENERMGRDAIVHLHTGPQSPILGGLFGLLTDIVHTGGTVGKMLTHKDGLSHEQLRHLIAHAITPSLLPIKTLHLHDVNHLEKGGGIILALQHISLIEIFLHQLTRVSQVAKGSIGKLWGMKDMKSSGIFIDAEDHLGGFARLRQTNSQMPLLFFGAGTRTAGVHLSLDNNIAKMTQADLQALIEKLEAQHVRVKVTRDRKTQDITRLAWRNNNDPGLVYKQHTGALEAAILAQEDLILSSMDLQRHTADIFYHGRFTPPQKPDYLKDVTLETLRTTELTKDQKAALKAAAKQWYDDIVEQQIKEIVNKSPHLTDYMNAYAFKVRVPVVLELFGLSRPYVAVRRFFESA